jgi:hypothetical protein
MVLVAALLVAHVGVLDGSAAVASARGASFVALRNTPLLAGDTLSTQPNSRLEVEFDPNVALRLGSSSRAQIVGLAYGAREIRLDAGRISVSMLREDDAPQVDTPQVTLRATKPGLYRVTVSGGETIVNVRRGTLLIRTPNGSQVLGSGEQVTVGGVSSQPDLQYASPAPPDAFDAYNATLDAALLSAQHDWCLPSALAGYANLQAYGRWLTLKPYGLVWEPSEYAGWAPYRLGRWLWRSETGWTWIPRESWGWLTYHYGAWAYEPTHGWIWVPPHTRAPAWLPSSAVFFTIVSGGHTSSVGWVPLAPDEPLHAQLAQYRNAHVRGGITLMSSAQFYSGDFSRISTPPAGTIPYGAHLSAPPPRRGYQSAPSPRRM